MAQRMGRGGLSGGLLGAWPLNVAILVHVGKEEQSRRLFALSSPSSRRFVVSGGKKRNENY